MPSSLLTCRYRIKDATSAKHLTRIAWAVNDVWNYCNEVSLLAWRREKRFLSAFDLINLTAGVGHELGLHTDTISEICQEYTKKKRIAKKIKLKWRSRKRSLCWIPFKGRCIRVDDDEVTYKGCRLRFWNSRQLAGTIKTGSFTQDACGYWYVNFQCQVEDIGIPHGRAEIGIDLGLKNQLACSDMDAPYSRENLTRKHEDALAMAQRARKKRRVKAIHAQIANARKDWAHKTTTAIVNRAQLIVVGNVSSTKLAKTSMAKSTLDAGWGQLRTLLQYKASRLGVTYREVNESGSSMTCSACLARTGPSGLSALGVRVWTCTSCGVLHDRDINAAHNILRSGRATPSGIPLLQ
jgi:putative transposase